MSGIDCATKAYKITHANLQLKLSMFKWAGKLRKRKDLSRRGLRGKTGKVLGIMESIWKHGGGNASPQPIP